MNRALVTRLGKTASKFAEMRLKWLQAFVCFTVGWLACAAWMLVIAYAPQAARALIAWLQG